MSLRGQRQSYFPTCSSCHHADDIQHWCGSVGSSQQYQISLYIRRQLLFNCRHELWTTTLVVLWSFEVYSLYQTIGHEDACIPCIRSLDVKMWSCSHCSTTIDICRACWWWPANTYCRVYVCQPFCAGSGVAQRVSHIQCLPIAKHYLLRFPLNVVYNRHRSWVYVMQRIHAWVVLDQQCRLNSLECNMQLCTHGLCSSCVTATAVK